MSVCVCVWGGAVVGAGTCRRRRVRGEGGREEWEGACGHGVEKEHGEVIGKEG